MGALVALVMLAGTPLDERAQIKAVLDAQQPRFAICHELETALKGASPEGKLLVRFTIDDSGKVRRVQRVRAEGAFPGRLQACVVAVIEDVRFSPPKDGSVVVTYPIAFTRIEGAGAWPDGGARDSDGSIEIIRAVRF